MSTPAEREALGRRIDALQAAIVDSVRAGDDLGDVLSAALGRAADDLGGTARLVDGRPGSWEAYHVVALGAQHAADGPEPPELW